MEGFQTIIIFSERKTKLVHYYFGLLLGLPGLLVHNWVEMLSKVVLFCWTKAFHEIFMEHKQSSARGSSRICPPDWCWHSFLTVQNCTCTQSAIHKGASSLATLCNIVAIRWSTYVLGVGCLSDKWSDYSLTEKKRRLLPKLSKWKKWQLFSLKMTTFEHFEHENNCDFLDLLRFDNSLSLITWIISQQTTACTDNTPTRL